MQRRNFLQRAFSTASSKGEMDEPFLTALTAANEAQIPQVLDSYAAILADVSPRAAARSVRRLASAYTWSQSRFYHDPALVGPIQGLVAALEAAQHDDGSYDQGNLHSPPDSSFSLQDLCNSYALLHEENDHPTETIRDGLARIIRKAGPMLATGGVHTPNHRWEVCAALARINQLWPDSSYVERIEEWLAEDIDMDADGQYSERSAIYAPGVSNPALLTIAALLGKDELIGYVRRNLEATLYLLEPNGEVETVHSRRQDQKMVRDVAPYLLQYRELALLDGNRQFAHVARLIEQRWAGALGDALAAVLERPELGRLLPENAPLPEQYAKTFPVSALARVRRGDTTASIFGGTDVHRINAIASGVSSNPTFFKMRKGAAILDSLRLAPNFFSMGHFRSNGLEAQGTTYRLSNEIAAAYHQPLPPEFRRADGDYAHTNDGRFYSQMDFPHRQKEFRILRTEVVVQEVEGGFDLAFSLGESAVPFTIELCFRRGGTLTGVEPIHGVDSYQLVEGFGTYTVGNDRITFGPGNGSGPSQPVDMDPGERYTFLGGNVTPDGLRVYITGRSPIHYLLKLRSGDGG